MPVHQRVRDWIANNYQKPTIDQEWLADCSDWLVAELGLDPVADFDQFIHHVEEQLLQSNLADSTVHQSGIDPLLVTPAPANARTRAPRQKQTTGPTPLLVEITAITEIAHSAFTLLNTHQTRLDRADLGLARDEDAEQQPDQDEGPVPRFPRGMLRFELSDGLTTFRAIEFRSLPQLELGTTPLGYKLLLKSTPIRNGVAFLEPDNVVLKGYRTEDHDVSSEQVFLSSLRKRLGRPDPPSEPVAAQPRPEPAPAPPAEPARQHQPPPPRPPSPPADLDDMYVDDDVDPDVLREMAMQTDEDFPAPPNEGPKRALHIETGIASPPVRAPSTGKTSSYFTAHSSEPEHVPDIGLSPRPPAPPYDVDIDDLEPSRVPVKRSSRPPSGKRPSSPDPFDDLSFDMDVDESFLEQVGKIEQGALGSGSDSKGKGKGRDTTTESRPSAAPATLSGSAPGTTRLAACPVSPSCAEPDVRTQSSSKSATSASSLSRSTESVLPQSTQSSGRRLPRDPSLIILSSSEDEAPKGRFTVKRSNRAQKIGRKANELDSEVIDISD